MIKTYVCGLLAAAALTLSASTALADPEIVSGPAAEPGCFAPWAADTKFFKFPKKDGPYRIALANGYIANTWRIQMIQTAKAYAAQPDVAAKLKEFKVVSTGEDVPAQISAINNFIDSGYDAARSSSAPRKPVSYWSPSTTFSTPRMRSTSMSISTASECCGQTG